MTANIEIACQKGIQCPLCMRVHDATDNEIEGYLSGSMACEGCGATIRFEADYTVTWYATADMPR